MFSKGAGIAAGLAAVAAEKEAERKRLLKGRTSEQKKVVNYLYGHRGCLTPSLTDEQYDKMVRDRISSMDFKTKALAKIGIDETEVQEIDPVHFEGAYLPDRKDNRRDTLSIKGKDGKMRSSEYMVTWLFFGDSQLFIYQYTLNMCSESFKEKTLDYFYKDITNLTTVSDSIERDIPKQSCTGRVSYQTIMVDTTRFRVIVPGDDFACAALNGDYLDRAVQGMKAKLREKKA
ncbi:MAG: hypothetical protein LUG85_02880 [Clostridiales bacterium]|nr:hypothetical protein [Clostridiales bacterium]